MSEFLLYSFGFAVIIGGFFLLRFLMKKVDKAVFGEPAPLTPATPISTFPTGETGRIEGKVLAVPNPLIAPLSGKRCVAFQAFIHELRGLGDPDYSGDRYPQLAVETKALVFHIQDETGVAEIGVHNVKLSYTRERRWRKQLLSSRVRAMLKRQGVRVTLLSNIFNAKAYEYRENSIKVGDTVSVEGLGTPLVEASAPVSGRASPTLLIGDRAG
ncbi:MAG: hypothetical protein AAGF89_12805 [Bacteroidota bacterium]